ncbi:MAG TPA: class I SAM-dependent methyltransferase [Puia sp.]|nr:class I SAM-dependent methyltransferase [Puia sp.]
MYSRIQLAEKYLRYFLTASNRKGHGVHSPFVYELVRSVLMDDSVYAEYASIEGLRRRLLRDRSLLNVEDLGAGSVRGASQTRSVKDIARLVAKPAKLGQLLFRLARHYQPSVMIELGTSLGLSTAYLAAGNPNGKIWSIEGSAAVAERARGHLMELGSKNAAVITGNFDEVLEPLLEQLGPIGLAFVDGNHRCEPTIRYFDLFFRHSGRSAMLIFDDIHWSGEMEKAWVQIKTDPRVMLTIDLFFFGLVVIRDEFRVRQDFRIRM